MRLYELEPEFRKKIAIIGVGTHYLHQLDWIKHYFRKKGYSDLLDQMNKGEYELYDMATMPEKGDALDHIDPKKNNAIVAMHLFGIHKPKSEINEPISQDDIETGNFYNKRNHELLDLARSYKMPLFVMGDQPNGHHQFWAEYK